MGTRDLPAQQAAIRSSQAWQTPPAGHVTDDAGVSAGAAQGVLIAELVGQIYEQGSAAVRIRLLEILIRPMSIYALISISNGRFAQIKVRNAEWQGLRMRAEDIRSVRAKDVVDLVEQVQQLGGDALKGLSIVIASSPALAEIAPARSLQLLLQSHARPARAPTRMAAS